MTISESVKGIVFGHPLTQQAIAELNEAKNQVEQAIKNLEMGLGPSEGNLATHQILVIAKEQLQAAANSLQTVNYGRQDDPYAQKEVELGAHRVREAITNLKDVLRMLKVPD